MNKDKKNMKQQRTFKLKPNIEINLKDLKCERIIIKKVHSSSNEIISLFTPIKVFTRFPNDNILSYFISAVSYFSNKNPGIVTDLPMNIKIRDCEFTSLSIEDNSKSIAEYELTIEYLPISIIEEITLMINFQNEGYVFALHPSSKKILRDNFSQTIIIRNIFIDHATKHDFENQHGNLMIHVFKALSGLNDEQIFSIKKVSIANSKTNKIEYTFDPNEQNV